MHKHETTLLAADLALHLPFDLPNDLMEDELLKLLSERINIMINEDFGGLIQLLYRLDIAEDKLKNLLGAGANVSSGEVIAGLIIQRQIKKIEARKNSTLSLDIPEDDKW